MGKILESSELKTGTSDIPEVNEEIRESEASDSVSEVPNDNNEFIESLQQDLENYEDSVETINVREYGLMECTEATKEIFTPEVVNDWGDYSREQKAEIVNEYSKVPYSRKWTNIPMDTLVETDIFILMRICWMDTFHIH